MGELLDTFFFILNIFIVFKYTYKTPGCYGFKKTGD